METKFSLYGDNRVFEDIKDPDIILSILRQASKLPLIPTTHSNLDAENETLQKMISYLENTANNTIDSSELFSMDAETVGTGTVYDYAQVVCYFKRKNEENPIRNVDLFMELLWIHS